MKSFHVAQSYQLSSSGFQSVRNLVCGIRTQCNVQLCARKTKTAIKIQNGEYMEQIQEGRSC